MWITPKQSLSVRARRVVGFTLGVLAAAAYGAMAQRSSSPCVTCRVFGPGASCPIPLSHPKPPASAIRLR